MKAKLMTRRLVQEYGDNLEFYEKLQAWCRAFGISKKEVDPADSIDELCMLMIKYNIKPPTGEFHVPGY